MSTCRVLLVEDDRAVCQFVDILLSTEPDFTLVGTVASAERAVELAGELRPDLVLLDNQLEGPLTGFAAAPRIKASAPGVLVLLCTALDLAGPAAAEPAIDGYLRKDDLVDLVDVVRALLAGAGPSGGAQRA